MLVYPYCRIVLGLGACTDVGLVCLSGLLLLILLLVGFLLYCLAWLVLLVYLSVNLCLYCLVLFTYLCWFADNWTDTTLGLILVLGCCWCCAPCLSLIPCCFVDVVLLWSGLALCYWLVSLCWLVLNCHVGFYLVLIFVWFLSWSTLLPCYVVVCVEFLHFLVTSCYPYVVADPFILGLFLYVALLGRNHCLNFRWAQIRLKLE
jgi:hypothetical protein